MKGGKIFHSLVVLRTVSESGLGQKEEEVTFPFSLSPLQEGNMIMRNSSAVV